MGIGPDAPDVNPFLRADLPVLRGLLDGALPTLDEPRVAGPAGSVRAGALAFPIDATLGVEGIPQSGTGQAALLTGENAPRIFGRHFGPWLPVALRDPVRERGLLAEGVARGLDVAFANAYPEDYDTIRRRRRRPPAAVPFAAREAGLLVRHAAELGRGEAVASEIVNTGWRRRLGHDDLPVVGPAEAGRTLATIARGPDLTLYAHYTTDYAGHRGEMEAAVEALERVDAFLGGVVETIDDGSGLLLLVVSDHGNVEEAHPAHTRNPALGLAVGRDAGEVARRLRDLTDVRDAALEWLGAGAVRE